MFATALKRTTVTKGNLTVYDGFWYGVVNSPSFSGESVTTKSGMQLWCVYACVSLISSAIASLPLKLKQRLPDGSTEDAVNHPVYGLVKLQPNPNMTSFTWRESGMGNLLTSGNKYTFIERGARDIKGLWPIDSSMVTPVWGQQQRQIRGNTIIYEVNLGSGRKFYIQSRDMLHVLAFSANGLVGDSVITNYAKNTIGNGIFLDRFQGKFFKNGIHTSGTFQHPETLGDNKAEFVAALKERYAGGENTGVPMVLENGMVWNQNKVSLVDQQFLEQDNANALKICGIFHIPPSKIGIYGKGTSYNNTEQQNKNYLDDTLMQWLVRWEQALDTKLLTPSERAAGYFFKHNVDALLRPDAKTRAEIAQIEWQQGVPLNVIRRRNDENPIVGGDVSYVPLNFIPASQAGQGERESCDCGVEHRTDEPDRESRAIQERVRVKERYHPLLLTAANKIMDFELKAVRSELDKHMKERGKREFGAWVRSYYKDEIPSFIEKNFQAVFRAYSEAISIIALREIGGDFDKQAHEAFIADYVKTYASRHVSSSVGQLVGMVNDKSKTIEDISVRLDEWEEKRAFKIAADEATRIEGAAAYTSYRIAGIKKIKWVTIGDSCPFCIGMNGRVIDIEKTFINDNEVMYVDEETGDVSFLTEEGYTEKFGTRKGVIAMKSKGAKRHPPLHRGCDCTITTG